MADRKENSDGRVYGKVYGEETTILQPSSSSNTFDEITKYIDENIRVFRYTPWLMGGAGVLLLLGSANMFRRYRGTMAIPQSLIHTNKLLHGRVVKCDHDTLYVWHTPLLRRLTRIGVRHPNNVNVDELIRVQFTGVSIATNHAVTLLNKTVGRPVKMKLLYRNDQPAIECIVYSWRPRWLHYAPRKEYCVNEELISLGLGTMAEPRGFIDTVASVKFLQQLARQERNAQLKGRGIWHGTDHVSSWNRINQWVNGKLGRSSDGHSLQNNSVPISAVAKEMSGEHRH